MQNTIQYNTEKYITHVNTEYGYTVQYRIQYRPHGQYRIQDSKIVNIENRAIQSTVQ